uniref:Uncharacterized protein n=1 Tax=Meloidogyne enterolobii TaxID=390850 RepID=A0A6V7X658_MELEN|nr:unnamed protein product [Meloidogyne enterolobii]
MVLSYVFPAIIIFDTLHKFHWSNNLNISLFTIIASLFFISGIVTVGCFIINFFYNYWQLDSSQ